MIEASRWDTKEHQQQELGHDSVCMMVGEMIGFLRSIYRCQG